jgi:SSS family solute:Na+ symporter
MAVYISGAGAVIIGGLYWAKGTTAGAWAGLATGFACSLSGIMAQQGWGHAFPLNGAQISFFTMLVAVVVYVIVSLLTCREDFNMDRMLHRGAYAKPGDDAGETTASPRGLTWSRLIGCDANFSRGDRWIASSLLVYSLAFFAWCLVRPWSVAAWSSYWHFNAIVLPVFIAVVTSIWFTWGGVRDAIDLFRRLREETVNPLDNGTVIGHQNLDDFGESTIAPVPAAASSPTFQPNATDSRENEMADR